jgi:hypothetical protein
MPIPAHAPLIAAMTGLGIVVVTLKRCLQKEKVTLYGQIVGYEPL